MRQRYNLRKPSLHKTSNNPKFLPAPRVRKPLM
jgi:hypothetical protein